jgi:VCBS repeat-containing protein
MSRVGGRSLPRVALFLSLSSATLVLAGCAKNQAASGSATLSITSPADGASVTSPVKLVLAVNGVEIGPPSTGKMHVHIHIDGSGKYQVLTSTTAEIVLSAGQHTIEVVLAQPNHTETATKASVAVTVTGGAAASPSSSSGGGYGYGNGS